MTREPVTLPAGSTKPFLYSMTMRQWTMVLAVAGTILFGVSGWIWYDRMYLTPERVFYGMLDTMMSTRGVTKRSTQTDERGVNAEFVQLSFAGRPIIRNYSQVTTNEGDNRSRASSEVINTVGADYIRYTDLSTTNTKADGSPIVFKDIVGQWAKRDTTMTDDALAGLSSLHQAYYVAVPVGNLPQPVRSSLVSDARKQNVYSINDASTTFERLDGHSVYVYDVSSNLRSYTGFMKRVYREMGLGDVKELDPQNFPENQAFKFKLTVDKYSKRLLKAEYTEQERTERYEGYGIPLTIEVPKNTISYEELSERLQAQQ